MKNYTFNKKKYGSELLIDLIRLESLEKYIVGCQPHTLSYYDITLISKGTGTFFLNDNQFLIKPNTLFFSAPKQLRRWDIKNLPNGLVLIFEEDFITTFFQDINFVKQLAFFSNIVNKALLLKQKDSKFLQNLFTQIEKEIKNRDNRDNHTLRALLYQSLAWLNNNYKQNFKLGFKQDNPLVYKFKTLVSEHFRLEHSVEFYASKIQITANHLNDIMKTNTGISAKKYIQNRLFLEAKKLLLYSSKTISEISYELNFQDNSYFVRAFKNFTNITPHTFRKENNQ